MAMLFVARAYFPSEGAESGSGLVWVFGLLGTAAVAVASLLFSGTTRLRWSWADAAVLALMLLVGMSATHAAERRPAIILAWEWGGLGLLYVLARNLPRTRAESATLAGVVVATAVAVAAYGLYQVPVEFPKLRKLYLLRPDYVLRMLGITPGSPSEENLRQRLLYSNEPYSTFGLANSLAGFLVGPLALMFAVALDNLKREGKGSRLFAFAMAAVPTLVVLSCLMMTKSRSAWVGLLAALLVLAWRSRRAVPARALATSVAGLAILMGVLVVAGVATKQLDIQVITQAKKSLGYRWEYWIGAWGVITDAPSPYASTGPVDGLGEAEVGMARPWRAFWSGVGPGNFAGPYLRHKLPRASEEIRDPHNMVLEAWATAGVFAAIALMAALGIGLWEMLGPSCPPSPETDPVEPGRASRHGVDPAAGPAGTGWLVGMAGAGWLAVWALGKLDPVAEEDALNRWIVLGAGWAMAAALGAPLWGRRPIPASGPGVAVLALAINLLAAGGIGIPSVAMSLWVLLALGLNLRDDRPCGRPRVAGGLGLAVVLACVWAALAGTYFGAIVPFWKSEAAVEAGNRAMLARPPAFEEARRDFTAAIEADRHNLRAWVALAALEFAYWQSPEVTAIRDKFRQKKAIRPAGTVAMPDEIWGRVLIVLDDALNPTFRNPNNLDLRRRQANYARAILNNLPADAQPFAVIQLKSAIVRACRWAARIYPTSATIRAELAEASADVGMFPDAVREANQALQLDEITPHDDKKLPGKLRAYLRAQIPRWEELAKAPPPVPPAARTGPGRGRGRGRGRG